LSLFLWRLDGGEAQDVFLAYLGSIFIIVMADLRLGPSGTLALLRPRWSLLPFALLGGLGATILSSELGNIWLSISDEAFQALSKVDPDPLSAGLTALLSSLILPLCLSLLIFHVIFKAVAARLSGRHALILSVLLGAIALPGTWIQSVALLILPLWIRQQSGALLPAFLAFLPSTSLAFLSWLGWAPGIEGFDLISTEVLLWQPIWFDLLGGVLLLAGLLPLMRFLLPPPQTHEERIA